MALDENRRHEIEAAAYLRHVEQCCARARRTLGTHPEESFDQIKEALDALASARNYTGYLRAKKEERKREIAEREKDVQP